MAAFEPKQYGNFILLERIAVGGMAEIFRAKKIGAEGFEKELVIKRILPHFSEDEAFVTMFKDEARIAANLNHANIVQIYEFDQCEGAFYIAMEYIEGKDLKHILTAARKRNKPLLPAEAVYIAAQMADGLHYAHTRTYNGMPLNIVHRDVSPHNVMISFDGEVKIMDFGIAKAAARSTKTQAGTVKGKCAYMAPEQARGQDLDGRTDMFATGICLWEMLTGTRLFTGDTEFEILSKVLKAEIPSPREYNPDVHPKLEQILRRAMARDKEMRFRDMAEFKQALMSFFYQHCDPDLIDLGAYMRWLYRKGPLPRSRQKKEEPPPTLSTEAYRPPPGSLPPRKQQALKPAPTQEPEEQGDRTAVMPELMDDLEARTSPGAPPPAQEAHIPDPTVPLEPYRPQDHEAPSSRPASSKRRPKDPPKDPPPTDLPPTLQEPVKSPAADLPAKRSNRATPVEPKGAKPGKGAKQAKQAKGGKLPVALVVGLVIALLVIAGGGVGAYLVFFGGESKAPVEEPVAKPAKPAQVKKLSLRITSEPPGADVSVNGELQALPTPLTLKHLKVGQKLRLRLRKRGYKPKKVTVTVEEGMKPVHVVLKKR